MKTRLFTAAIGLPILIGAIILPYYFPQMPGANYLFIVLAGLAIAAGLFEYFSLTKKIELKADAAVGYIGAALFFVGFVFDAPSKAPEMLSVTLVLFILGLLITQTFRFREDFSKMLGGTGATLLGVMYVAFLGGYLVSMRVGFEQNFGLSSKLLGFFFLVVMGADAGAYFIGKSIGKHKLIPSVSPGKTWEGFIGGIVLAVGFAAIASATFFTELPFYVSLPIAAIMSVVSVFGDLTESAIKRGSKAKDAARILPGHGGLLDRLDSLLFNAPILYYFAQFYF